MKKKVVVIVVSFMILLQTFALAQGTGLFCYVDEGTLKNQKSEVSILSFIKNRSTSTRVYIFKFLEPQLLFTNELIQVNLPDISVQSTKKYAEQHDQNTFTWFGRFADSVGSILLVVTGNDVTGMIHSSGSVFSIEPLGNGFHALIQLDQSRFSCELPCIDYHERTAASSPKEVKVQVPQGRANITQSLTTLTGPTIDILVAYTPAAASASGNIYSLINGCISTTNNISSNSDANPQVRLVYPVQVDYTESGSLETDKDRLANNGDGFMDGIHSLRDLYGADVVVLLVASGDNCGYADGIEVEAGGAFASVQTDCAVNNYSFAHEVGHLVGGRHDTDDDDYPRPYAHGYFKKGFWKTVMAINFPATRIPYWSNPNKTYNGLPMGTTEWNNVTRVWNERGSPVSNFFPTFVRSYCFSFRITESI